MLASVQAKFQYAMEVVPLCNLTVYCGGKTVERESLSQPRTLDKSAQYNFPETAAWGRKMTVVYQPVLVLLSIGVAILGSLTALALTSGSRERDFEAWHTSFALANGGLIMGSTIWSMHFIAMMAVDFPMVVNYNLIETIASICIAIAATGAGLYLASTSRLGFWSIPAGGVLMGLGIAGMHYLGMSAIRGCGLAYDLRLVAASVALAIGASIAALWFAFYKRGVLMTLAGGIVQGLAITSMHYTAMAATYFVPLGMRVELATPLFPQSLLAYMITCGMVVLSAGNLTIVALIAVQQGRSA